MAAVKPAVNERVRSRRGGLTRGNGGLGVEAGTALALSALLQTCLSQMWEEHCPLHGCGSEQVEQGEPRDCEAECSPFVICMRMACFSYITLGSFLP